MSVFISYSWKDLPIAQDVIIPMLRDNGINYFIDYENFRIGSKEEHSLEDYIARRALERLYRTTAFKPWQDPNPKGKPLRWLPLEIEREIAKKEVHLVLMSQFASESFWVNREVDYSLSLCHKMLVVRLDNALLPNRLMTLVNSRIIPSIKFTGENDTPRPSSYEDQLKGWFSSDDFEKWRSMAFDAYIRHGVSYRKPEEQDRASLIAELDTLSKSPSFSASQISIREDEFEMSSVLFQFVTISGTPYFSTVSMLKFPVTVEQFGLYDPKVIDRAKGFDLSRERLLRPVTNISWEEAKFFCEWLTRQTGYNVRLPYEVEWEFACRAGSPTKYSFGDDESLLDDYAWYNGNHPQIVGRKKPNLWGLYDMHGNIGEWCADVLNIGEVYSMQTPATFGKVRVIRGGGGTMPPEACRSGFRHFDTPDSRQFNRGFRLFWRQTKT